MWIKQNVRIIHISKSLESMGKHTIVQITIMQIKQNVRIIQGHIIWVLLYQAFVIYYATRYTCTWH